MSTLEKVKKVVDFLFVMRYNIKAMSSWKGSEVAKRGRL